MAFEKVDPSLTARENGEKFPVPNLKIFADTTAGDWRTGAQLKLFLEETMTQTPDTTPIVKELCNNISNLEILSGQELHENVSKHTQQVANAVRNVSCNLYALCKKAGVYGNNGNDEISTLSYWMQKIGHMVGEKFRISTDIPIIGLPYDTSRMDGAGPHGGEPIKAAHSVIVLHKGNVQLKAHVDTGVVQV